ncbi:MAG TPA: hypothetical protein PLD33_03315 [Anaerolineales bacterium]|nr:hypothetical protein [Anaerolineales bacterium]HNH77651.1 hypothetical protein [Anaerolineales bacterium]
MKPRITLDTVALSLIALLVVAAGLVILFSGQIGVRVTATLPERSLIGPFQKIKLTFSESVDHELAESLFSIQPKVDGTIEWLDARTMQFVPTRPFERGASYKLTLSPGRLTQNGSEIKSSQSWDMRVRDPLIVYLVANNDQSILWTVELDGSSPQPISPEEIKVIAFDASADGESIVFSSANSQGGIDLWRMSRAGGDAAIMLDCGRDRCTTPAIAPNGVLIAYTREAAGVGPGLPYGSPRIWVLDLQNGETGPVYEDQQVLGYKPSWSPDSSKLISFDGLADQFRLFNFTNNEQILFQSNTGGAVTWSPDGTKFLYTDIDLSENGLVTRLRLADLALNDTSTLLGNSDSRDYAYNSMAWSPSEDSVVVSLRNNEGEPAQVFWLFDPGLLDGIIIADQPGYTYNSPLWDPWGTALVFQQFKLRGEFTPEIGLWQHGFREPLTIAEGIMPHWLP